MKKVRLREGQTWSRSQRDRKSTRLNSSHANISYAVFCLKKKIAYLKKYMPEIKIGQRYSHYFYGHYYPAQALRTRVSKDWNQLYPPIRHQLCAWQSPQGS